MIKSPLGVLAGMMIVYGLPAWAVVHYWRPVDIALRRLVGSGTVGDVMAFLALLLAIALAVAGARYLWAAVTGRTV